MFLQGWKEEDPATHQGEYGIRQSHSLLGVLDPGCILNALASAVDAVSWDSVVWGKGPERRLTPQGWTSTKSQ